MEHVMGTMPTSTIQTGPNLEIRSAESVYAALSSKVSDDVEEFWVLALGPKTKLLGSKMIFRGTVDACIVHPREVFRFACLQNASSIIIAHNHPSGDFQASPQDLKITRQLLKAAQIMEIPILDHVILTKTGFSSFAREGWCRFPGALSFGSAF